MNFCRTIWFPKTLNPHTILFAGNSGKALIQIKVKTVVLGFLFGTLSSAFLSQSTSHHISISSYAIHAARGIFSGLLATFVENCITNIRKPLKREEEIELFSFQSCRKFTIDESLFYAGVRGIRKGLSHEKITKELIQDIQQQDSYNWLRRVLRAAYPKPQSIESILKPLCLEVEKEKTTCISEALSILHLLSTSSLALSSTLLQKQYTERNWKNIYYFKLLEKLRKNITLLVNKEDVPKNQIDARVEEITRLTHTLHNQQFSLPNTVKQPFHYTIDEDSWNADYKESFIEELSYRISRRNHPTLLTLLTLHPQDGSAGHAFSIQISPLCRIYDPLTTTFYEFSSQESLLENLFKQISTYRYSIEKQPFLVRFTFYPISSNPVTQPKC
ncbi:MAG: hypothetical protein JWO53_1224 [Chlamydiia bacterium]|nr:hypothetical protein [Chlamydiia bacterium]